MVVAVVVACSMIGFFVRGPDERAAAVEQFVRAPSQGLTGVTSVSAGTSGLAGLVLAWSA